MDVCKCKMEKEMEAEKEIQSNYAYDHNSVQYRQIKFYNVRIITESVMKKDSKFFFPLNKKLINECKCWEDIIQSV